MSQKNTELKREVGFLGALSSVVGTVIGAGVFFKIAAMASRTGSANLVILAWVLAAIFTVAGGLTVAELGTLFPETGGGVKYLEHAFGKLWGFLFGWVQTLIYYPANIAGLAIIWATQFNNLFGIKSDATHNVPVAILVFATILIINSLGTKFASRAHSLLTVIKLIPIALIVIFGLLSKSEVQFHLLPLEAGDGINPVLGVGSAIVAAMFAFDGWIGIGNIAGELKKPKRDLPLSLSAGLMTIAVVYLLVSLVMLRHMPIHEIMGNNNTASEVAQMIFGKIGGKFVTVGILISVYGALNGYSFTAIRVPYALAAEGNLPFSNYFSKLNKNAIPMRAGGIIVIMAVLLMLVNLVSSQAFNILSDLAVFSSWAFYGLLFIAVFRLRKTRPDAERSYKVIGYPITPLIAIAGAVYILYSNLTNPLTTISSLVSVLVTLIGIPVFYRIQSRKK
ncbi:APC family permease [Lactococcus insecticola]|uniref:Amino acid permease n=1 Tax=Pseudolactococcus insecticola TaxID=2709158 RepID=A0A6A0B5Y3_9LACT|nr:amino acid permease [Lactococcus insecticola]GFH40642.1 amino acid permease [Lactococcus insecticola]